MRLRIPDWAEGAKLRVNGAAVAIGAGAGHLRGHRAPLARGRRPSRSICRCAARASQDAVATCRNPSRRTAATVEQEVLRFDYLAITRGPLVYATTLIDGYKIEETLRISDEPEGTWLETVPAQDGARRRRCPPAADRPRRADVLSLLPRRRTARRRVATHVDVAGAGVNA